MNVALVTPSEASFPTFVALNEVFVFRTLVVVERRQDVELLKLRVLSLVLGDLMSI